MRQLQNRQPEKPLLEQLKEQIDLAEEFDRLQAFSGWEKVLRYMGAEVNSTLLEATRYELDPAKQAIYVNQWNAKRSLLDKTIAYMESAQNERDRIVEEYKEM
jgi:hypothetical protein